MSDVSRVEVRPEYAELAAALMERLLEWGLGARKRFVVGVAGESGSGKSVTASTLARTLVASGLSAVVLHQDDYFHLPPRANHAARERDIMHVGPGEVNLELMQAHIAEFLHGGDAIVVPMVNYATDRFEARRVELEGVTVLVVEGTYVLGLEDIDLRIFLEATYADTRDRRRTRARDVDSPFVERVLAREHDIIARCGELADLVVDRNFAIRAAGGSPP